MNAEPQRQRWFSFEALLASLLLAGLTLFAHHWFRSLPNRTELGETVSEIRFEGLFLTQADSPWRLAGAWKVTADDPRFAGVSALAFDGDRFLALTDSGVVVRFPRPGGSRASVWLRELPAGPGDPRFKHNRDSEALVRARDGRGWWVAFENADELWLYDSGLKRVLERQAIRPGWSHNRGIEALALTDGGAILVIPESGRTAIRMTGDRVSKEPLAGSQGPVSDAARVGPLLYRVERKLGFRGFTNHLVIAGRADSQWREIDRVRIPVGPLDNVEAMATERIEDSRVRIWLMTDDNGQWPFRTVLIALDGPALPTGAAGRGTN